MLSFSKILLAEILFSTKFSVLFQIIKLFRFFSDYINILFLFFSNSKQCSVKNRVSLLKGQWNYEANKIWLVVMIFHKNLENFSSSPRKCMLNSLTHLNVTFTGNYCQILNVNCYCLDKIFQYKYAPFAYVITLLLTREVQEVLRDDFDVGGVVGNTSLWGVKNSIELPVANQPLSRYLTIYVTEFVYLL